MSAILWVLQAILSIKLISVAFSHGLQRDKAEMRNGIERMRTFAKPLLTATSLTMLMGALALVGPAISWIPGRLATLSAAVLAPSMLLAVLFHVRCRDQPKVMVSIVLFAMTAFVAYGRWRLSPL
jgi:hypothetical protein